MNKSCVKELDMGSGKLFVLNVYKDQALYDIHILTTRSRNHTLAGNWIHVPELSPSPSLNRIVEQWMWNKKWPKMWEEFKRLYLLELTEPKKQKLLNGILLRLSEGLNVAIGCDSINEKNSHNIVIAEWVASQSYEVMFGYEIRPKSDKREGGQTIEGQVSLFDL
jgi:uncharacterized protein YeaO (DUF488 family)